MGFDLCSPIISLARKTSYSSNKTSVIYLLSTLCVIGIYNTQRETQALSQGSRSLEKQHSLESLARQSEANMWTSNNLPFTCKCCFFSWINIERPSRWTVFGGKCRLFPLQSRKGRKNVIFIAPGKTKYTWRTRGSNLQEDWMLVLLNR